MLRRRLILGGNSFSPRSISNMALWLKSNNGVTLVGGAVDVWADQSGNGQHVSAPGAINRPSYSATLNGKAVVTFNGINSVLRGVLNNNLVYTGPLSIIAVVRKSATAYNVYETILSAGATGVGPNNSQKIAGFQLGNHPSMSPKPVFNTDIWSPAGVQGNSVLATSTVYKAVFCTSNWSLHRTLANSRARVNGVDQSIATFGVNNPTSLNTSPFQVGALDYVALSTSYLSGDIAEIIVYNRNLSSKEIQDLEYYLLKEWGV